MYLDEFYKKCADLERWLWIPSRLTLDGLDRATPEELRLLGEKLEQHPNVTEIDLSSALHSQCGNWSERKCVAFSTGLRGTQVDTINLAWKDLYKWDVAKITAFFEGLEGTNVTTLILRGNFLYKWDEEQIRALANGLRERGITTVNLVSSGLSRWDSEKLTVFVDELQGAQISIDLEDNDDKAFIGPIKECIEEIKKLDAEEAKIRSMFETTLGTDTNKIQSVFETFYGESEEGNEDRRLDTLRDDLSVASKRLSEKMNNVIERGDTMLSLLFPIRRDWLRDLTSDFYTAALSVAIRDVVGNIEAIEEYLDKMTYITNDDAALNIANEFLSQPKNRQLGYYLFYRLAKNEPFPFRSPSKVNLDDMSLRRLFHAVKVQPTYTDEDFEGAPPICEDSDMSSPGEICKHASLQLKELPGLPELLEMESFIEGQSKWFLHETNFEGQETKGELGAEERRELVRNARLNFLGEMEDLGEIKEGQDLGAMLATSMFATSVRNVGGIEDHKDGQCDKPGLESDEEDEEDEDQLSALK